MSRAKPGGYRFTYSRRVESQATSAWRDRRRGGPAKFERAWAGISDAVLVTDSDGRDHPRDRAALARADRSRGAGARAGGQRHRARHPGHRRLDRAAAGCLCAGRGRDAVEGRVAFRGWRIASFTTYASVRERVNGVLALEIMGFAILLALAFYFLSRKTAVRMALFQRESAELRALNARLQREIAERERVQENLAVAEQTLAQSSQTGRLGRDVGGGQPRAEPAAGGDENLSGGRAAVDEPQPPRRGAVVLSADRRSDRADGRDHAPAQVLCAQGRTRSSP